MLTLGFLKLSLYIFNMEEIWRDIKDYEGLYQVSNMGRVKSLGRWSNRQKNGVSFPYFIKEKILKNRKIKGGYYIVGLCKDKISKDYRVSRLVAEAFIPNPDNKLFVDHIDTNPLNNFSNNLRWVTQKENMNNPLTLVKMSNSHKGRTLSEETRKKLSEANKGKTTHMLGKFGKDHHNSRPIIQFTLDGELIRKWDSIADAKRETGAHKIVDCCNGKRNKTNGFKWEYYDTDKYLIALMNKNFKIKKVA